MGKNFFRTCLRIGFGTIAAIHQAKLAGLGIQTIGVVEVDITKHDDIKAAGLRPFATLAEAMLEAPDFFDICSPTETHAEILESIINAIPDARILVEKPLCDWPSLESLETCINHSKCRIAVNENYASSKITELVRQQIQELGLTVQHVVLEMTKHRGLDFASGRFVDVHAGVLGYEGSHLLCLARELGVPFTGDGIIAMDLDGIVLKSQLPDKYLKRQGGAFLRYQTADKILVELYTSVAGVVGYAMPPFAPRTRSIKQEEASVRHRLVRVDGIDKQGINYSIAGFYEPVKNQPRDRGGLMIFREKSLCKSFFPVEDDSMRQHLQRVLAFFEDHGPNPYSGQQALADVRMIHAWAQQAWDLTNDTDDILGDIEIDAERARDCEAFWQQWQGIEGAHCA